MKFLSFTKTPPQCLMSRIDDDGIPKIVQHIFHCTDTNLFKAVTFDGNIWTYKDNEFGIIDLKKIPGEIFTLIETLTELKDQNKKYSLRESCNSCIVETNHNWGFSLKE